ncbi:hypothetical protein HYH02_005103 [Chlamydomonas schloesseri]|uniref:Methyltransferase type 11 domain-containing protein n=1 Tax=Chlamydomonas schloesseri TaxID=2026947 RepID=A0A836B790_9CHLO|nr:hypothetical protein HYH02_005103 [Chlamydomonas schloesseri]|eukprot:KAG2449570.1 hypothetical protein HYH02_005103 [Chlamydomonas schloesseri]
MALDGYSVTNVDISPVVIEQMKLQHSQLASLDYLVADCRDMASLPAGGFGSCIDKGTLDAVLCSASGQLDAAKYMREICRLLKPGGVFLLISLGAPAARLALLQKLGLWQDVQVLLLPKPLLYLQSDAAMSGRPPPAATAPSKDAPVEALGPWPAATALAELAARREGAGGGGGGSSGQGEGGGCGPDGQGGSAGGGGLDERDYFFAYVCTTRPAAESGAETGTEAGTTPATGAAGTGSAAAGAAEAAIVAATAVAVEAGPRAETEAEAEVVQGAGGLPASSAV